MQQMLAAEAAVKARGTLNANSQMNFVQRALDPNQASINNQDGTHSSHSMMYGSADGRFWVFPTVISVGGKLQRLSGRDAFMYALKNRQAIPFKDEKEAAFFSEYGYKLGSGMLRALP